MRWSVSRLALVMVTLSASLFGCGATNGERDDEPVDEPCVEGWCPAATNPCLSQPCGEHGTCVNEGDDRHTCYCHDGYSGHACQGCADGFVPAPGGLCQPDPCPALPCVHGTCTYSAATGLATCACESGYAGALCDACASGYVAAQHSCVTEILFALPVVAEAITSVIGFDHDPAPGLAPIDCTSYDDQAFPFCYDQHDGTDFMLAGGFDTMDAGSSPVLAAAPGEVISVHDGEFDRCYGDLVTFAVTCPGYASVVPGNHVKLRHPDGKETWYWHFKTNSILVQVGQEVDCGAPLGLIGSSGMSTAPHLHFEVHLPDGTAVDPYAGPASQPNSHWFAQPESGLPGAACQ